jgi:hypothetical protein
MSSALFFFAQAVHTVHTSVSHSQFDKHLQMSWILQWHPLCVAVMHPPKSMPFADSDCCALCPGCCVVPFSLSSAHSKAPLTQMALHHVIGSFSQATSEDRHIGETIPILILKILEELSTFNFRQPTRWVGLKNSKSTRLCQSTIPHSTNVDLFYSVREIHFPNVVWDSCGVE